MQNFEADSATSCAALNLGKTGDRATACEDAFAALVHRQSQFVFRVAYSVVRNVQDAEDIAQETFLKLYRLNSWTNLKNERAFLARATWRIAVGRIKRGSQAIAGSTPDNTRNPESDLIQSDESALLHRLIDALPQDLRLPLALSTVDEMTSPEIAKIMSIPESSVRTRLMRAREILKRKLLESNHV